MRMRIAIHIEIGTMNELSYNKEILSWIRESESQVQVFDFDNHSDAGIIQYAMELLKGGDEILVIINQLSRENTAPVLKFIDSLVSIKQKSILVLFNGEDVYIDRMLATLSEGRLLKNVDVPEQQNLIRNFFRMR